MTFYQLRYKFEKKLRSSRFESFSEAMAEVEKLKSLNSTATDPAPYTKIEVLRIEEQRVFGEPTPAEQVAMLDAAVEQLKTEATNENS